MEFKKSSLVCCLLQGRLEQVKGKQSSRKIEFNMNSVPFRDRSNKPVSESNKESTPGGGGIGITP
jgi:hypothetical protein